MCQKCRKDFTPLRYCGLGEYRRRRRHISTCLVRSIFKLQPVKSLLEGRLSTGYHGNRPVDASKTLRGPSVSLRITQEAQSGGKNVNPRQAKSTYYVPAEFTVLLHGFVYQ